MVGAKKHVTPSYTAIKLPQLVEVKATTHRDNMIGCLGHVRQAVQARAMRHGGSVDGAVVRRDRVDIGKIAQGHDQQVPMRQHRPFGASRRAARIEEPGGGIRRHVPHGNGLACTARPVLGVTGGDNSFEAGDLLGEWGHGLDEVWRGEAQACSRVFEDVGELTLVQLSVHRHGRESSMPHRVQNLDVLRAIAHGERHAVPWLETKAVCQCPGELCHPVD